MTKIVILGDAHLWPTTWQRMPEAAGDSFAALGEVMGYAIKHECPVIASGDVLNFGEKGGVSTSLAELNRWIPKLRGSYYIVGTHHAAGYTSGVQNDPWLSVFNSKVVEPIDQNMNHVLTLPSDVSVAGLNYRVGRQGFMERLQEFRATLNGQLDVFVIHQAVRELLNFDGAWEIMYEELEKIAKFVVCGHVHVALDKKLNDGTRFVSPGSTVTWQMDEDHAKRFPVLDIGGGTVEWIPIEQRRAIFVEHAINEDEQKAVLAKIELYKPPTKLCEDLRVPILRLQFYEDEKFYRKLLQLQDEKRVILDLLPMRRVVTGGAINFDQKGPEQADEIVLATEKHTTPGDLREAAIEIQKTRDPEGVIDKYLKQLSEKGMVACGSSSA